MAFANRLRLARAKAGLSLAALSLALDHKVTPQAINKYEKDGMMPSSSVLVGLARALGVSIDFLMSSQVVALEGVEFRKKSNVTDREKAAVEAEVIDHVERYLSIEGILDLPERPSAMEKIPALTVSNLEGAEERAEQVREIWGLGTEPVTSMTALLEEKDARVIEIDGPDGFFGLTCRVKRPSDRPPVTVVVRRHVNVERDRFTLAHELAHAAIGDCTDGKPEKAMDRFAGAFLVPAAHLKAAIGASRHALGYDELVSLKHCYGVSMMALMYRLRDVGILSETDFKNLFRTPARSWLKSEPSPLSADGETAEREKPRRFQSHVYRAVAEGLIPLHQAADLLKRPLDEVEFAIRGPRS